MGRIQSPPPVKLFAGVLVSDDALFSAVEDQLATALGGIDHRSPRIPFDFTDYYSPQMGEVIDRMLFSFENLIDAGQLPSIKNLTNRIEEGYHGTSTEVARPVNIDPGYIEQSKVVLASTKNFYHRIYLSQGVYAEVTMHFKNNTYRFFPWTYPDYKSREYQEFFIRTRQIYRTQLRNRCVTGRDPD